MVPKILEKKALDMAGMIEMKPFRLQLGFIESWEKEDPVAGTREGGG